MLTKYDKAAAAAIASAMTGVIAALTTLDAEVVAALGVILNSLAVFLVPNME
ncbi:hypothetical protein [Denitrobaculum tricleocarpae]|uniref:hypothetical protein n=1 Tax=Denitrobaculum tricleocarpae TaxID=2591009 RepID=UPI0015D2980E|nr:hypothetical protein [Denitrobaculum tricleocarpae]